eukprot:TRINITY_DN9352_c0_g1_i2.p1 TRINITY_DN9352_c0_g1~~TRINITY_DN9352_c0_g1_i2.p1  ORF type:complete len:104 (-),score=9.71 TRINITY_DN9352_c0_g1_i2:44-355(-)
MPPAAAEGETDTAWREAKLPVVDLASPDADRVMVQACKDYGFFVLTNHGKYSDIEAGAHQNRDTLGEVQFRVAVCRVVWFCTVALPVVGVQKSKVGASPLSKK